MYDFVFGKVTQHGGEFAIVGVPEFDASRVDRDEHEELFVKEYAHRWTFIHQIVVSGLVLFLVYQLFEPPNNPVRGFGNREANEVVGVHVERLYAREVACIPNFESRTDVCGHNLE